MIFQFGEIKFEILNAPTSMRVEERMNFVQVDRISGKPVIQELGVPLIRIEMSVELRYQFVDVPGTISAIRGAMYGSEEHELINGAGFSYGVFKIESLTNEILKTDSKGQVTSASLQLSFIEYAPYDQESDDKIKARQKGFASISASPIEVKKREIFTTPQAKAALNISLAASTVKESAGNIKKAESIPDLASKYLTAASRQLSKATEYVTIAKAEANKVTTAVGNIEQLKSTLDNTISAMGTLTPQLVGANAGTLPGIITGPVAGLEAQMRTLTSTATLLSAVTAIRRK